MSLGHTTEYYARERTTLDFPSPLDSSSFASTSTPIVIDNGASTIRAGWASHATPHLIRDNITSKFRERKGNKPIVLAGQDVYADASSKANLRMAYEQDVLCGQEAMVSSSAF